MANWATDYGIHHLAIIPDGNRRWAQLRGLPQLNGHQVGLLDTLPRLIDELSRDNLHTITVWGFSTENWKRSADEVSYLMEMFKMFLEEKALPLAHRHEARILHLGRCDRFPSFLKQTIDEVERQTSGYTHHVYNVALDYGGMDEIERAAERAYLKGGRVCDHLDTVGQEYEQVDLLVRFSEQRLSGFMPVQTSYAEIAFVDMLFPDTTMAILEQVGKDYSNRARRFGA